MDKKNVTIKDIAHLAGVSIGTVDRVLHNRGRVSEEALQRVKSALEEIDYKPNLIARTLGTKKNFRIAVVMPDPLQDEYWNQSKLGLTQAAAEWMQYDILVEPCIFDLSDKGSFLNVVDAVLNLKPDGIVFAPIFHQEALSFLKKCDDYKIPVIVFNANLPETNPLSFIGQDLYESGKLAAELIHLSQPGTGTFVILHINEHSSTSVHLAEKQKGFEDYFKIKASESNVLALNLNTRDQAKFTNELETLFAEPQLKGALVTTSKGVSLVAKFLEQHSRKDIRLIGYDLLQENIHYLKAGIITFLINQNSKHQTFLGINHLANFLFLKKEPPLQKLLPLEIITRENLNSYLNH